MRLPPLNALRAFEAAARLGGFARAGEELNVSPGAVSRHVKLLEAHFGTPLFVRLAHGLRPTEAALALLPKVSAAFEMIATAASEMPGPAGSLKVMASPTFANRLLVPSLPRFTNLRPEVSVSVALLLSDLEAFDPARHDCAIATLHDPTWPAKLSAIRVRSEALTPLCAPSLLAAIDEPLRPEALGEQTLLQIAACPEDWPEWFARNGVSAARPVDRGPSFETGELAIRAAVEGLGIVIMDRFLVQRELEVGELIDLFPDGEAVDNGYYFLCAGSRWEEPRIARFRDWIVSEFANQPGK